jgi:hypothetical protein
MHAQALTRLDLSESPVVSTAALKALSFSARGLAKLDLHACDQARGVSVCGGGEGACVSIKFASHMRRGPELQRQGAGQARPARLRPGAWGGCVCVCVGGEL